MVRWSNPLMIGTRFSHSYFRVLMTLSVTEIDPCLPTAPRRGFMFQPSSSSAKTSPVKTLAWSEIMCFGAPCFSTALSKALLIHPALGPPSGVKDMTLREKWSITTQTYIGQNPQHNTFVVSIDQTWLGYHAGIERSLISLVFLSLADDSGVFRGLGFLRILRTVEAEMKMFSNASWLAIRTRPQAMFDLVISQIKTAISSGVLLPGIRVCLVSLIWWSQR